MLHLTAVVPFPLDRHPSRNRQPLAMTALPKSGNLEGEDAIQDVFSTTFGAFMHGQTDRIPTHVRAFSELLIRLRAELGNDLDLVLIMAVIAERHYAGFAQPKASNARARATPGINAHSVALYADIPRETVRRKVTKLVEKGWVKCDESGNLTPAPQAASDLADGTSATLKYLDAIAQPD